MKKTILFIVLATLWNFFGVYGQDINKLKPLKIGDKVPDFIYNEVVNYSNSELRLSDFTGKNIIIDFWATYCTSCLARFKLSDSLQREFKSELQILLVDGPYHTESKERVINTLRRFDSPDHKFSLPSIINDGKLIPLFPHYTIPHYVWIDKNRIVKAITAGEDITRESVLNFIKSGITPNYEKKDFDRNQPLYTVKDLPLDKLEQYSIFLKGKIEGIGNGGIREINNTARGIILHNRSLYSMYQRMIEERISGISDNRIIISVKDSSGLMYLPGKYSMLDWNRNNLYSYELIIPANQMDSLFNYVLDDLNRLTRYHAGMEKRKTHCYVLERISKEDKLHTSGGEMINQLNDTNNPELRNCPLLRLIEYLTLKSNNAIVLDETGYKENIDIKLLANPKTVDDLTMLLSKSGLKLSSSYRDLDMLVIRDK
jgi:thiol-disulfide isomerase/thioredoxin